MMNETAVDENSEGKSSDEVLSPEEQNANFLLRSEYLKLMSRFVGMNCEFTTVENNKTQGIFRGINADSSRFCVENLQTPIGQIPYALIRGSDIINMEMVLDPFDFENIPSD